MATKCSGRNSGRSCPVRQTCLHWLGLIAGVDTLKDPKSQIDESGCQAYARMSSEMFRDSCREVKGAG